MVFEQEGGTGGMLAADSTVVGIRTYEDRVMPDRIRPEFVSKRRAQVPQVAYNGHTGTQHNPAGRTTSSRTQDFPILGGASFKS